MSKRDDETRRLLKRWSFARTPVRGEPEPTDEQLGRFAREILWQLEQLWERDARRPTDVSGAFRRRLQLAACSELIYHGEFPAADVPRRLKLYDWQSGSQADAERAVLRCKGSKKRANQATAKILNTSVRSVERARQETIRRDGAWEFASEPGHLVERDEFDLLDLWRKIRPRSRQ